MALEIKKQAIPTLAESNMRLFGTADIKNDIKKIDINLLVPFENQPFRPYSSDKLRELAEDIKINGILSPVIVKPVEDGKYQILAGHNRTSAAKLTGMTEIPCIVKNVDDDTAKLIVVNTNLNQRQELLHSEKAFAYKMQLEAMKRQAGRPKENSDQLGPNLKGVFSTEILAEKSDESQTQIKRYIRLTYLIKPMLDMIDNNKMPFMVGVNLSFLSEGNQDILYDLITDNKMKITLSQAEELKRLNNLGDFSLEMLDDFFNIAVDDKPRKPRSYKFSESHIATIKKCLISQKQIINTKLYDEIMNLLNQ